MNGTRWMQLLTGLWLAGFAAGCGGNGSDEDLNLEEQQLSTASAQFTGPPSVALGPDGRLAVTWVEFSEGGPQRNYLQRFTADGFKDGPLVELPQESFFIFPVDFGPQGESFVAWTDVAVESDAQVFVSMNVQRYATDGSPQGPASLVRSRSFVVDLDFGTGGQGVILGANCQPTCYPARLLAFRLAADGSQASPEILVSDNTTDDATGVSLNGQVAVLEGGGFVVFSQDLDGARLHRFTAEGARAGAPIHLGSNTYPVSVGIQPGGGFVAAWSPSSLRGLEGQRYAADGSPMGGRFTVQSPSLASAFSVGPDGSMVALFNGFNRGGLSARRLAADGAPLGAEIDVRSLVSSSSESVALGPLGRFFVAWSNVPNTSPPPSARVPGVYGRLFAE